MALSFLDSSGLSHLWSKIKSTFATKDVVSKTANGLAPQLPNETTTTKFLRQDGSWAVPPSGGGGNYLPLSGGTMDNGAYIDMPSNGVIKFNNAANGAIYSDSGDLVIEHAGAGDLYICDLADPSSNNDAANKKYVDNGLATKLTTGSLKFGEGTKSVSLSANGYAWSYFDIPSGRTMICPTGYYIAGTSNTQCVVYAYYADVNNKISMAIRTWASTAHTVTVHFYYLYI